ncbi:MAG: hypothetical protein IKE37_06520 [Firmicutes bacterium]|nr:hypothetical protein [Bacillota bacterium]
MADCKHELKDLVGMADGIHCMKCGAILKEVPAAEPKKAEPKKEGKKNARK